VERFKVLSDNSKIKYLKDGQVHLEYFNNALYSAW
jgi:hypothetical protein